MLMYFATKTNNIIKNITNLLNYFETVRILFKSVFVSFKLFKILIALKQLSASIYIVYVYIIILSIQIRFFL